MASQTSFDTFHWTKNSTLHAVSPKLSEALLGCIKNSMMRVNDAWSAQDCGSLKIVRSALASLLGIIEKFWTEKKLDAESLFAGFQFLPDPNFVVDDEKLSSSIRSILTVEALSRMFDHQYRGLSNIFKKWFASEEKIENARNKSRADIKEKLKGALFKNATHRMELRQWFEQVFIDELRRIKDTTLSELDGLTTKFLNERVAPSEKLFKESSDQKKRIGDENLKMRTTTIEPMRKKIEEFEDVVVCDLDNFSNNK